MDAPAPLRFGPFAFHPDTGELWREGRPERLEPQPARLLALLVARPGRLVTREEIRRHLWGDEVHVEVDRGIAYALNQVRAALGDSASEPRYVETLPRRGYRFVAPVAGPGGAASRRVRRQALLVAAGLAAAFLAAAVWLAVDRPLGAPRVLLAVSAFDNETGRPEHDALVARMADTVVARLVAADLDGLGVIGNQAVLRRPRGLRDLPTIHRETGAHYVVIGQLQPDPAGLRVIAHLIRLDDGTHLWAERYVRPAGDLGGLDREVADGVAQAVAAHLAEPLTSP
jgi:DNA-binding winged helix-turn-helix (wHTH) protein/TolB-like protein